MHGRENTNVLAQNFALYLHMRIMFDITFSMYKYVYSEAVRIMHTCLGLWDVLVYTVQCTRIVFFLINFTHDLIIGIYGFFSVH